MKGAQPLQLWSATPTPLTPQLQVDVPSVERMVEAAVAEGMDGLFLAGTCGEGQWLQNRERIKLIKTAAAVAQHRMRLAVQVSDNSVPRILDNIADAAAAGADFAIIASPAMMLNATPARITALFEGAANASPLPVGIYDLGTKRNFSIPLESLKQIYLLPNVQLVKDSSADPERREIALAAKRVKPGLMLLSGDEFHCIDYLMAGYDGAMFGGAVAVAPLLRRILRSFQDGQLAEAIKLDADMRAILYGLYGGESIECWLTGLKQFLVYRGMFSTAASFLEYPLTESCRAFIKQHAASLPPLASAVKP